MVLNASFLLREKAELPRAGGGGEGARSGREEWAHCVFVRRRPFSIPDWPGGPATASTAWTYGAKSQQESEKTLKISTVSTCGKIRRPPWGHQAVEGGVLKP